MNERRSEALAAALSLLQEPRLARLARNSPLPAGVKFLLEVIAGDADATAAAAAATARSEATIRNAAEFFIEQVLLASQADSYRILGANSRSSDAELRRHMVLLMKWLHPDLATQPESDRRFDKSAFASRVTTAWESVKTPGRRAAYDASIRPSGRPDSECASSKPQLSGNLWLRGDLRRDGLLSRILLHRGWR